MYNVYKLQTMQKGLIEKLKTGKFPITLVTAVHNETGDHSRPDD